MRRHNRPQEEDYQAKIKPPRRKEFKTMSKLVKQAEKHKDNGNNEVCNEILNTLTNYIESYTECNQPTTSVDNEQLKTDDNIKPIHSTNQYVVVYPSEEGWKKIEQIIKSNKIYSSSEFNAYIDHTCIPEGLKIQLWELISVYSDMFFNGSSYWENTNIKFVD